MGISLKHSGHFFVVGSTGGSLWIRDIKRFIGKTTKKYTAVAISKKESREFKKSPSINVLLFTVKATREKSGLPSTAPTIGVIKSFTKALTTLPKAAPTARPTARSTTFPRRINFLKSFSMDPHG